MPFYEPSQIEMPPEFPEAEHRAFNEAGRLLLSKGSPEYGDFLRAGNAIVWRFRACYEHRDALVHSWRRVGTGGGHEEIYVREKELYGVFTTGVSYLESITYATFLLCAAKLPTLMSFATKKDRQDLSDPGRLGKRLSAPTNAAALASALTALNDSPTWRLWKAYRNTHSHRTAPPRLIRGYVGRVGPPAKMIQLAPTWSTPPLELDDQELNDLLAGLGRSAVGIMTAATAYAQS